MCGYYVIGRQSGYNCLIKNNITWLYNKDRISKYFFHLSFIKACNYILKFKITSTKDHYKFCHFKSS